MPGNNSPSAAHTIEKQIGMAAERDTAGNHRKGGVAHRVQRGRCHQHRDRKQGEVIGARVSAKVTNRPAIIAAAEAKVKSGRCSRWKSAITNNSGRNSECSAE